MNLKILSMAFLMGVSTTPLLAQPTLPTLITCTNTSDTICVGAATVYNDIVTNVAVTPALTQELSRMLGTLTAAPQTWSPQSGYALAKLLLAPSSNLMNYATICPENPSYSPLCPEATAAYNSLETTVQQLTINLTAYVPDLQKLASDINTLQGSLGSLSNASGTIGLPLLVKDFNALDSAVQTAESIQFPPTQNRAAPPQKKTVPSKK